MFEFQPGVAVWTLISFALVYLVVHRMVFPVIRKAVVARRSQIEQSLAEAEARQAEAQAKARELEERLRRMGQQELEVLAEAREKGRQMYAEHERKALEDFRLMRKQREGDLQKMEQGLAEGLRAAFARTVVEACHKVMRTELTPEQQRKILDERISQLQRLKEF